MKFNKIVAIAIVLALVIVTSKTKTSLAISTITVATSTNFQHDLFIENRTKILQASQSNFVNAIFCDFLTASLLLSGHFETSPIFVFVLDLL